MSDDGNFAAVPPMVAQLSGMPSTTAAMSVSLADGTITVERELEGGALEVVQLPTPCLVAVQSGLNQVRYASLKGIMAAKKKPVDVKTAADLGVGDAVGADAAKVSIEKVYVPPKGEGAELVEGSADEVAQKLVGKIKELGLL
jgi:electron transfer flavoprotein beta subunit